MKLNINEYKNNYNLVGTDIEIFNNWLLQGKQNDHITNLSTNYYKLFNYFDFNYYINENKDLSFIKTREQAWNHWFNHGYKEDREYKFNIFTINDIFDKIYCLYDIKFQYNYIYKSDINEIFEDAIKNEYERILIINEQHIQLHEQFDKLFIQLYIKIPMNWNILYFNNKKTIYGINYKIFRKYIRTLKLKKNITTNKYFFDINLFTTYQNIDRYNNIYLKSKKILIVSTQWPYNGGAATNAYLLTSYLRNLGYNTACLFLEKSHETRTFDPLNIKGIFNIRRDYKSNYYLDQYINDIKTYLYGEPDIIFSLNILAPIYAKQFFYNSKIIYCTTGSKLITELSKNKISIQKYYDTFKYDINDSDDNEEKAFNSSDYIIFNSNIMLKLYLKIYSKYANKFIKNILDITYASPSIKNINVLKKFDICAVVSNFNRQVKNPEMIYNLFNYFSSLNKLAIGNNSDIFNDINNITLYQQIDNKTVQTLMAKSKIIIVPSFIESAGIVIKEAIDNNCIPIVSRNVGISDQLDDICICNNVYDINEWIKKIEYIITNFDNIKINSLDIYISKFKRLIIKYIDTIF